MVKEVSSEKRSKGLKQLLKESKQAKTAAHSHENVPDTALYLNTLKGHADSVVSVEISADNASVITASEDKVCQLGVFQLNTILFTILFTTHAHMQKHAGFIMGDLGNDSHRHAGCHFCSSGVVTEHKHVYILSAHSFDKCICVNVLSTCPSAESTSSWAPGMTRGP